MPVLEIDLPWYHRKFFRRVLTGFLPLLGYVLVWTHPSRSHRWKLVSTLLVTAYLLLWTAALFALALQIGWIALDWYGGDFPRVVRRRFGPNYVLLLQDRSLKAPRSGLAAATNRFTALTPYWTDLRGPGRQGHYDETPIRTRWPSRGLPELWRQPCGGGYASFIVAEGLAITLEQRLDDEALVAYSLETGLEVWKHSYPARFEEWMSGEGPRATPVYMKGFVFSLGATGELYCLGARRGTPVWHRNVLQDAGTQNLHYGLAASPLVVGELLLVPAGGPSQAGSLLAYDTLTGQLLWRAIPDSMSYASPVLATLDGTAQVLLVTASRVLGFDPSTQTILWEAPWEVRHGNAICPPVIVDESSFFLGAGYGKGGALFRVRQSDGRWHVETVWQNRHLRTKFNPAVCVEGSLYGLDEGVLVCVEAQTGRPRWRGPRVGYGQLLAAGRHLLVLGGTGKLLLVEANPHQYRQINTLQALTGKTWNIPALAHGLLLVRNSAEMACYQISLPRL